MDDKIARSSAHNGHTCLQIRGIGPDLIRLMWQPPRLADDPLARTLAAEEAMHDMFRPLCRLVAQQRLARRSARRPVRLVSER